MIMLAKPLSPLFATLLLMGCADGLMYGERTSFDLASVRLNDDPSEPVSVKLGFNRSVAMAAPAIGGKIENDPSTEGIRRVTPDGEAVSHFSSFTLGSAAPFANPTSANQDALLDVQTRFASGQAAIEIAGNPEVVAAIMGIPVPSAKEQVAGLFSGLSAKDRTSLCRLAAKDFDDLTPEERKQAGELSGFLSLYDGTLHLDVREQCHDNS
jgi:hypothetical protein